MAKNKGARILITLECTQCRSNVNKRSVGVSRYLTKKNRRNNPERIELKKYNPLSKKHEIFKEIKKALFEGLNSTMYKYYSFSSQIKAKHHNKHTRKHT